MRLLVGESCATFNAGDIFQKILRNVLRKSRYISLHDILRVKYNLYHKIKPFYILEGLLEWYYFWNNSFVNLFQKIFTVMWYEYYHIITKKTLIKARVNTCVSLNKIYSKSALLNHRCLSNCLRFSLLLKVCNLLISYFLNQKFTLFFTFTA